MTWLHAELRGLLHEIILNRACFYCGTTDLDPIALSPKRPPALIAPSELVRKKAPGRYFRTAASKS